MTSSKGEERERADAAATASRCERGGRGLIPLESGVPPSRSSSLEAGAPLHRAGAAAQGFGRLFRIRTLGLALTLWIPLCARGSVARAEDPAPAVVSSASGSDTPDQTAASPTDSSNPQPADSTSNDILVHEKRPAVAASQLSVPAAAVEDRPINRPSDLLQAAPGLFTT